MAPQALTLGGAVYVNISSIGPRSSSGHDLLSVQQYSLTITNETYIRIFLITGVI